MKIYFAGSIRGGRDDIKIYSEIIDYLSSKGEVLTEHIKNKDLYLSEGKLSDEEIHNRDINWILESDVLVAEVTTPSLGVGYEIGQAISMGKKILCLYRPNANKKLSAMIAGSSKIINKNYVSLDEAKIIIDDFFNEL